jgi:lysophospholipase L1-like esterase
MGDRLLAWIVAVTGTTVVLCTGAFFIATPAQATGSGPAYYLALGGSDSVGFQPTAAVPHGAHTDEGYADDLVGAEHARWDDLELVQLGCPGETTLAMLEGGDRCSPDVSQLSRAVSFLRQHPSTVLVTVDVGFNDMVHCLAHHVVDEGCVDHALADVRTQLPQILAALRAAGGPKMQIVGVGRYDPYLQAYLEGAAGQSFAAQSLGVTARLNETLRSAYEGTGIPMADVAGAFDMNSDAPATLPGGEPVPLNVARTCALTWECVTGPLGHNKHPNTTGYRLISEAISDELSNP